MAESVNLIEIAQIIIKRWWILFLCMIVCGVTAYGYSKYIEQKEYVSVGRMYIDTYVKSNENNNEGPRSMEVINASQRSVLTCIEVLKSTRVLEKVAEDTNFGYNASAIRNMITMSPANNTEVLEISVNCSDYRHTKPIVDSLMKIGAAELKTIVGVGTANVIDEGTKSIENAPVSPNIELQTIVGAFAGILLGALGVIIVSLMDKRIKAEEDLQKYELPVLGVIPDMM
ncbi:MAG: Wzz/FepE/Etk N-terminal domain-containing protein [Bacillota bacterium]|nr:Wzz/FepE/Etk N-terminal domain-containing protein [Bacillota bacterium]